jgi:uncharacterized protein (TIGR02145 family)
MKHCVWIFLVLTISSYSQTPGNGVTDIDGNQYSSVIIGTQEWMKKNLNVSKYSDGTVIPQVTDPTQWANLTTGAWCYYNNDTANGAVYGKLYNWYAVAGIHDNDPSTPNKILAPQGWHVPSDAEWSILINHLDPNADGGNTLPNVVGGKMKSTGTLSAGNGLWNSPNTDATNESGFSGLPAGLVSPYGTFSSIGLGGYLLSSSEYFTGVAWGRIIDYDDSNAYRLYNDKRFGFSVRCLNNNLLSNTPFKTISLKLYPNPVVSILNVKTNNNLINQSYTIIDSLGRVVLNGKLNKNDTIINVEQLSEGIYYLKVSSNSANKFIKE